MIESCLAFAGPLLFGALQVASLREAVSILRKKTVDSHASPLGFLSLLVNSCVWSFYGVIKQDNTVLLPNVSGSIVGLFCSVCFYRYVKEPPSPTFLASTGMILAVAILWYISGNLEALGLMGCVLSVLLSGSPLVVIKDVIKTRDTTALPFGISLVLFLNALSWLTYGYFVADDPMIYGPNALALLLSSIQMSLFFLYGLPPAKKYALPS